MTETKMERYDDETQRLTPHAVGNEEQESDEIMERIWSIIVEKTGEYGIGR